MDPISDMLTRIRNASSAGHSDVLVPISKMKKKIAELIESQKFTKAVGEENIDGKKMLKISLKYIEDNRGKRTPYIQGIRRISRQGQRIYVKRDKIPYVKSGHGFAIISTSRGLMTDSLSRKSGLGGEIICEIW